MQIKNITPSIRIIGIMIISITFLNLSIISASLVISPSTLTINKTKTIDKQITLNLTNNGTFPFSNISFEDNLILGNFLLDNLSAGQSIQTSINVTSDQDFKGNLRLRGFYEAVLGKSSEQKNITIDFSEGLSECHLSMIKGSSITWNNNVNDEVKLKNEVTGVDVTTISKNSSYTTNFDSPELFTYSLYRRGLRFTEVCTISILNDVGFINDPNLDFILSIDLVTISEPTTIEVTYFETNYTLDLVSENEGVISIKNTGTKTAKNIDLDGSGFTFSPDNFDIEPGITKSVIYKIKPFEFISETNQTGKNHKINVTVSGNFPINSKIFNVFVNFAEISDGQINGTNSSTIVDFICQARPDLCNPEPRIIYRNTGNGSNNKFNITFEEGQARDMMELMFNVLDDNEVIKNFFKTEVDSIKGEVSQVKQDVSNITGLIFKDRDERINSSNSWLLALIVIFFIIIMILLILIIRYWIRNKKLKELDRM